MATGSGLKTDCPDSSVGKSPWKLNPGVEGSNPFLVLGQKFFSVYNNLDVQKNSFNVHVM